MGIVKQDYRIRTQEGGIKATPVEYWNYGGLVSFMTMPEGGKGAIVRLNGYSSFEARAMAKANNYLPDCVHEFVICNWSKRHQESRPATIEEKKAAFPHWDIPVKEGGKSKKFWEELKHDVVVEDTITHHMDYDKFMQAFNTDKEVQTVYEILKSHMYSFTFFEGAQDV